MNTFHDNANAFSDHESDTTANNNRMQLRLKVSAAALLFALPVSMYADNAVDKVQESFELHIEPEVLEGLPAN